MARNGVVAALNASLALQAHPYNLTPSPTLTLTLTLTPTLTLRNPNPNPIGQNGGGWDVLAAQTCSRVAFPVWVRVLVRIVAEV